MKKITLLIIVLITGFTGFSQPWNFDNSADGWAPNNGNTVATNNTTFINLQFNSGDDPSFENAAVSVDATDPNNAIVAMTIRNNSATGPTELRFGYLKSGGGIKFVSAAITQGDTGFNTYYIDLTNNQWSWITTEFILEFRNTGNSTFTGTGETLDIDKIEFVSTIPTQEKNEYTFDTTNDGWSANTRVAQNTGAGDLEVTLTSATTQFGKVGLVGFHVDATANKYMHVIIKNTSANDKFTFTFPGQAGTYGKALSTSDTSYITYDIDLSADTGWDGNVGGLTMNFDKIDDALNIDNVNAILIDQVIFDNVSALSVARDEITNLSLYPNPVKDILTIKSNSELASIKIFNVVGQKVFEQSGQLSERINLSELHAGVYFVKLTDNENRVSIRKIILEK